MYQRFRLKESELCAPFKHMFGKECLGRYPLASGQFASELLDKLLQHIAMSQVSEKWPLRDAVYAVRMDSNFWFLNLYNPMEKQLAELQPQANLYQQQPPWLAPPASSYAYASDGSKGDRRGAGRESPYKGKGGKGSAKGSKTFSKGQQTTLTGQPVPEWQKKTDDWHDDATKGPPKPPNYPGGQAMCYSFHSEVGCTGSCHRDHNHSPRLLSNGSYCFEKHCRLDCTRR